MSASPLDGELGPYLKYSAAAHAALALALAYAAGRIAAPSDQTYRIDFIGPTSGIVNRDIEAAGGKPAPAAEKPPPLVDKDAFGRKGRRAPLPRPSFLSSAPERPSFASPDQRTTGGPSSAPASPGAAVAPGDASVSADMPDFPYPWYIAQVRASLWSRWSLRMPPWVAEATVQFAILRNGAVTDLRVESSSGERRFDDAAVDAVRGSAPFAPLPRGFAESFLKIHVRFRSQ